MSQHERSLRSSADLATFLQTHGLAWADTALPSPEFIDANWPMRIPLHYAQLIDWTNPADPLLKMVVPSLHEQDVKPYELADPIGDHDREVVPNLLHRYHNRVLILLPMHCAVHCRFCFRKEEVGHVQRVDLAPMRDYLLQHPEVDELIFSGGDPLALPVRTLETVKAHFLDLPQIKTWRFHSRVPAVDPESISPLWLAALPQRADLQLVLVTHINHPRELTPATIAFFERCQQLGITLLSQSVLLKGINNDAHILAELFDALVSHGVKPYYLHHLDQAKGTAQFRVSVEEGKQLMREVRELASDISQPSYVIDLPGGFGKNPVENLSEVEPHLYQIRSFEGIDVQYRDQAES